MRQYLLLSLFFIVACKKENELPKATVRQQPSKISVFTIDSSTGAQTLQYAINYFYNDSLKRFDSIDVAGSMYRFNYSKFDAQKKMLLNFTDSSSPYSSINFDANFYSLSSYQEFLNSSNVQKTYNFNYDVYKKITGFGLVSNTSADNYTKIFTTKNDSVFIETSKPSAFCSITDTLINTYLYMSSALPYLLFFDITKDCSALENNILKALPVSNFVNSLPYKIINGIYEISYTYYGDTESRLKEAIITVRFKSNNRLYQKQQISFSY